MKEAIRLWMGGQDFYDPASPVSSYCGVLSFKGRPIGLSYYSYVSGRHHQIIADDCDPKVRRYFKNRVVVEHNNIMALIDLVHENPRALSPVGTDALVLRHITAVNATFHAIGAMRPFRSGSEYLDGTNIYVRDQLTLLLYQLQTQGSRPFLYLVKTLHDTDAKTLKETVGWRAFGDGWFATRDLTEFTLFKIGRVNSIPIEIS